MHRPKAWNPIRHVKEKWRAQIERKGRLKNFGIRHELVTSIEIKLFHKAPTKNHWNFELKMKDNKCVSLKRPVWMLTRKIKTNTWGAMETHDSNLQRKLCQRPKRQWCPWIFCQTWFWAVWRLWWRGWRLQPDQCLPALVQLFPSALNHPQLLERLHFQIIFYSSY